MGLENPHERRHSTRVHASARSAVETITTSATVSVGALEFETVSISHDANEPLGVIATSKTTGARTGIVYDLGVFTQRSGKFLQDLDILMIERITILRCSMLVHIHARVQRRIAVVMGI
jgi:hypothetical protein